MTGFGLRFLLSDGSRAYCFIFQDTRHFGTPRWFEVAEAASRQRPRSLRPDR